MGPVSDLFGFSAAVSGMMPVVTDGTNTTAQAAINEKGSTTGDCVTGESHSGPYAPSWTSRGRVVGVRWIKRKGKNVPGRDQGTSQA